MLDVAGVDRAGTRVVGFTLVHEVDLVSFGPAHERLESLLPVEDFKGLEEVNQRGGESFPGNQNRKIISLVKLRERAVLF